MFNIQPLTSEIVKRIECPGTFDHCDVSLGDGSSRSFVMIRKFMDLFAKRIKNMDVYDDDIWVITFPKCGTTWTQEMVWMLSNNLDYETAMSVNLINRFPFLELNGVLNKLDGDSVGTVESLLRPRFIKSHLPTFMLPDKIWSVKPKIIYVARNPKDVAISFFHHYRHIVGYDGPQEYFIEAFLNDKVIYAPFNDHVMDFWKIRDRSNILFLHYEDMKRHMSDVIRETMKFLGKDYNQSQIDELSAHLSIESMRNNKMCNNDELVAKVKELNDNGKRAGEFRFIRKGQIGAYKDELSYDTNQKFDLYMAAKSLKSQNFSYKI